MALKQLRSPYKKDKLVSVKISLEAQALNNVIRKDKYIQEVQGKKMTDANVCYR